MHPASTPGSGVPTRTPSSGIEGAEGAGAGLAGGVGRGSAGLLGGGEGAGGVGSTLGVGIGVIDVVGDGVGAGSVDVVGDGSGDGERRASASSPPSDPPHAPSTTPMTSVAMTARTFLMLMRRADGRDRSAYREPRGE